MISLIIPEHNEENLKLVQEAIPYLPFDCEVVIAHDPDGDGKGAALREGLKVAKGDIIVFLDGDMDIQPRMIERLLPFLKDYDIAVGTKTLNALPFRRKVITLLSRIYIRLLFGLTVNTQTGIKVFKRDAIPDWKTDGFAYDIEVLAKAKKQGKTMVEVPVEVKIVHTMPLKSIWKTLKESLKIRRTL